MTDENDRPDPQLDETRVDEEALEAEEGPGEGDSGGVPGSEGLPADEGLIPLVNGEKGGGAQDDTEASTLRAEDGHPPPVPPNRPPVPVFGHSVPSDDGDVPLTRSLLDPDEEAVRPRRPVHDPDERVSDRRWRPDLSDTPGLVEARGQVGAWPEEAQGTDPGDLDDIFDRPERLVTGSAAQYDPEAGRTNVAIKVQVVKQAVRSAMGGASTPFGRLILAIPISLTGIAFVIMAITLQETWMIVAACVVMPIGAFLVYRRYQAWLGHKRYMYRLLESLGEDVSDFDPLKANRRIGRAIRRK